MNTRILAIVMIVVGLLSACSAPDPFKGREFEAVRAAPELPYFVKLRPVKLDVGVRRVGSTSIPTPELARPETAARLAAAIGESLDQHNVFAGVSTADAPGTRRGGEGGPAADYELSVIVKGELEDVPRAESTPAAWYSTVLWFLMVVPGWFPEDVRVDQDIDVVYALYPAGSNTSIGRSPLVAGSVELEKAQALNFYRRGTMGQFWLQLILPPAWIPPDPVATHQALYENYRSYLQSEIARSLKVLVPRMNVRKGLPELFVFPARDGFSALILSDKSPSEIKVERIDPDGAVRQVCRLNRSDLRAVSTRNEADWIAILRDLGVGSMSEQALQYNHRFVVKKSAAEVENLTGARGDSFLRFEAVLGNRRITRTVGY